MAEAWYADYRPEKMRTPSLIQNTNNVAQKRIYKTDRVPWRPEIDIDDVFAITLEADFPRNSLEPSGRQLNHSG